MLKTIGLCVMVISGAGFGMALSGELSKRKRHLEMLLQMTILLKGEIRYGNTSLYDAFTGAAGKLEGKYREFFLNTAKKMQVHRGENFGMIFRKTAKETLGDAGLTVQEREMLYSLGDRLGYLGMDMQLKQLELMEKELEYSLRELQKDLPERKKIRQSMGILLGIFLAVLAA